MKKILASIVLMSGVLVSNAQANLAPSTKISMNEQGAIVVLFHRFGENKYPSTNIRTEQLDAFILYLKNNDYKVLPLKDIIQSIQSGKSLPPKTIAITVDDSFKSVYTVAYPKFKEAGFPFTIFVSTEQVNAGNPNYTSWSDIIAMSNTGVDIQNHTVTHPHMVGKGGTEITQEITDSQKQILSHTGIQPTIFAYPYGEADISTMDLIKSLGFSASFGQYSGVINSTSNMFYLPRFSINETYGTLKRLKVVLNTKPFPVTHLKPINPIIKDVNPPQIEFTVGNEIKSLKSMNCYQSGVGKVSLEKSDKTVYLNFSQPFKKGRSRINCTMPHPDGGYRWYGMQYLVQ